MADALRGTGWTTPRCGQVRGHGCPRPLPALRPLCADVYEEFHRCRNQDLLHQL